MTIKAHYIRRDPTQTDVAEHLGGGRDRCHYDPTVLQYLRDQFGVKTMLDVGCGLGCTVMAARHMGIVALGIDGDPYCKPDILHDYSKAPVDFYAPGRPSEVDLVWSMEFLEHVDETCMPNYMPTFLRGKHAFVTFAPPGKGGHHHVNCMPQEYWVERFAAHGFTWLEEQTAHIRKISHIQTVEPDGSVRPRSKKRFIKDYGLLFRRD